MGFAIETKTMTERGIKEASQAFFFGFNRAPALPAYIRSNADALAAYSAAYDTEINRLLAKHNTTRETR